jgi:hypothetical protein
VKVERRETEVLALTAGRGPTIQKKHIVNIAKPAPRASRPGRAALDELIEQITVDAYGEDEQLWAFRQAFEDRVAVPCDALVIGEPVSVVEFDYDGNERRGLTAKCLRPDGRKHVVAASDVEFPHGTEGERYVGAYRKWMGLTPFPPETASRWSGKGRREMAGIAIDAHQQVELAVLSVKSQTARCRFLGSDRTVTLRSRRFWVPGEIVRVKPRKKWLYGNPHLSAEIESTRIDARAHGIDPAPVRGAWRMESDRRILG